MSVSPSCFVDLTDVTLADEDTNSILINNANMQVMQIMPVMQVMQDMQVMQVIQVKECIQRR